MRLLLARKKRVAPEAVRRLRVLDGGVGEAVCVNGGKGAVDAACAEGVCWDWRCGALGGGQGVALSGVLGVALCVWR